MVVPQKISKTHGFWMYHWMPRRSLGVFGSQRTHPTLGPRCMNSVERAADWLGLPKKVLEDGVSSAKGGPENIWVLEGSWTYGLTHVMV